jgi:hypothetical protein
MPIRSLLEHQGFDPESVKLLVTAFERIRGRLDPSDQLDPLVVELVAKLTIEFAKQDAGPQRPIVPDRLCELVLEALGPPTPDTERNPTCPSCGRTMTLAGCVPMLGGLAEVAMMQCRNCNETMSIKSTARGLNDRFAE